MYFFSFIVYGNWSFNVFVESFYVGDKEDMGYFFLMFKRIFNFIIKYNDFYLSFFRGKGMDVELEKFAFEF